jgi:hypothetical protein
LNLINRGCDTSAFEKLPIPAAEVFQLGSGKVFLFEFVGIAVSRRIHQTNASVSSALPGQFSRHVDCKPVQRLVVCCTFASIPRDAYASDVVMSSLTDIRADEVELMLGQRWVLLSGRKVKCSGL